MILGAMVVLTVGAGTRCLTSQSKDWVRYNGVMVLGECPASAKVKACKRTFFKLKVFLLQKLYNSSY